MSWWPGLLGICELIFGSWGRIEVWIIVGYDCSSQGPPTMLVVLVPVHAVVHGCLPRDWLLGTSVGLVTGSTEVCMSDAAYSFSEMEMIDRGSTGCLPRPVRCGAVRVLTHY